MLSKTEKIFYWFLFALIFYIVLGFKLVSYILEKQVIKNLNENLTLKTHIKRIEFNPFTFSTKVFDFKLGDIDKPTVSFKKLELDIDVFKSLTKSYVHIEEFTLKNAFFKVIQEKDDSINLAKLLKTKKESKNKEEKKENSSNIDFLISKINLENANINFTKRKIKNKDFKIKLKDINYQVANLGTYKNPIASNKFWLNINDKAKLSFEGSINPKKLSTNGNLKISNLHLEELINYKKEILNFSLDKNAKFNMSMDYSISAKEKLNLILDSKKLEFKNINLYQNKAKPFALKTLDIDGLKLNLAKQKISLDKINLKNTSLNLIQNRWGLNLNKLIKEDKFKSKDSKPWNINIKNLHLNNTNLTFNDLVNKVYISNKNFNTKIKNINVNKNINVSSININNPNLNLIDKKNEIHIKSKKITLNANKIQAKTNNLNINSITNKISKLTLVNKKDKTNVNISNMNIKVNRFAKIKDTLKIANTSVSNTKIAVILNKKPKALKTVNNRKKKSKKTSNSKLDIGAINIKNTNLTFEDKNLALPFKTTVHKLNGKISEFKSKTASKTSLELNGVVNKYGLAKITGIVNPNDIKILSDISMIFKNIAMNNFNSYSQKYVGRTLETGKLNLDLNYNITKSNLEASNSIIISKLKFGKEVKSKEAVSLPLDLAIAILEDKDGIIDLNIPVSGNIDDPKFKLAPIIWQALGNIITKAITAPFSLLASLFGFDENEIKSVNFDFGENKITAIQKETLDKISKILIKRPHLAIKLQASYDKQKDLKAMKKAKFDKDISLKIPNKLIRNYKSKYLSVLENKYKTINKNFKEKKQSFVKDKKLDTKKYTIFLENELISKEKVSKKDLVKMAKTRIENIKAYLVKQKKNSSKQIILSQDINAHTTSDKTSNIDLKIHNIK